jgi:hypothetical protein
VAAADRLRVWLVIELVGGELANDLQQREPRLDLGLCRVVRERPDKLLSASDERPSSMSIPSSRPGLHTSSAASSVQPPAKLDRRANSCRSAGSSSS